MTNEKNRSSDSLVFLLLMAFIVPPVLGIITILLASEGDFVALAFMSVFSLVITFSWFRLGLILIGAKFLIKEVRKKETDDFDNKVISLRNRYLNRFVVVALLVHFLGTKVILGYSWYAAIIYIFGTLIYTLGHRYFVRKYNLRMLFDFDGVLEP